MSKEKQIEEIARVLCDAHEPCSKCVWSRCNFENIAIHLYNAGYRKQSEGEWIYVHTYMRGRCSICNHQIQYDNQPYCANCGAKMKGGAE